MRASDVAYEAVRHQILDLTLPPGAILNEHALARELDLGRMPVREALARLAGDQLLEVVPRRGAVVAPLDLDTVVAIFDAREAVECGIAHVVTRRATAEQLVHLREMIEAAEAAKEGTAVEIFLQHDCSIHRYLLDMMGNHLLHAVGERLIQHNLRFWRSFFATSPAAADTMMSHLPLLAALEAHDGPAAQEAMRDHLNAARQLLKSTF
ncbi:FCD domain-containing protein [Acidimicrobiaceae bacterium USS-CC1]|uniref:FCD domain-containing protein n=1 Tax=Acidiferrimicrobium australe TaxID=2664430 RepID=A0ABW9QQP9_9ACTN|nr:FCD domain-containing protein [Acidiferrimicrobium australe]